MLAFFEHLQVIGVAAFVDDFRGGGTKTRRRRAVRLRGAVERSVSELSSRQVAGQKMQCVLWLRLSTGSAGTGKPERASDGLTSHVQATQEVR